MGKTIRASIYLDKGGTGKTTTAAHVGAALHQHGHDILLIDLAGKQGDLADGLGVDDRVQEDIANEDDYPNVATTMGERWTDIADLMGSEEAVDDLVYETETGVDLIPAHPDLDGLDADLGNVDDVQERYSRLRVFLDEYVDPLDRWDIVLLDMPGLANNITYNGLWATGNVVTPVSMGSYELKQTRSLEDDLEKIRSQYRTNVELQMIVPNLHDRRTNLHEEKLQEFREEFGDLVAPEYVVDSQQVRTATDEGVTLFDIPEDELLKTGRDARDAFDRNARELFERLTNTDD